MRGWVFGGSLVTFFIMLQALLNEIEWAGPGNFAALLAAASAASLPVMSDTAVARDPLYVNLGLTDVNAISHGVERGVITYKSHA